MTSDLRHLAALSIGLLACGPGPLDGLDAADGGDNTLTQAVESGTVTGTPISWKRVTRASDVTLSKPKTGKYRLQLIDVGTGLAMLIQGADFTMLYDGGSGDDGAGITAVGNGNRLLAYLFAALGPSGPAECTPDGDGRVRADHPLVTIDHLVLSHPHEDHDNLLDDVLRCYKVSEVWDSGDDNNRVGYARFLAGVAAQPGVIYHNAAGRTGGQVVTVGGTSITLPRRSLGFGENEQVTLGSGASFKVLHVDPIMTQDENLNSIVLRLQLGATAVLLMGDAESGPRAAASTAPSHIEADLVARHAMDLRADVLQVAHHGSATSSRLGLLQLVQPRIGMIGVGPLPYSGVVLPDQSVLDALNGLRSKPTLLRTDRSDTDVAGCNKYGVKVDRIGNDDTRPGGCDNYVVTM